MAFGGREWYGNVDNEAKSAGSTRIGVIEAAGEGVNVES